MARRRKCKKHGCLFHDIGTPDVLPYVFCQRLFCNGTAVSKYVKDVTLTVAMHNAIPIANRVPPVTLKPDGTIDKGRTWST